MRSLFVFASLALASAFAAAATDTGLDAVDDAAPEYAAPAPVLPSATEHAEAMLETATPEPDAGAGSSAGSGPPRNARAIEVDWDGVFGNAIWVSGEYDVAGCSCWLMQEGDVSATLHGTMEPGTWSGGVELTWDATANPTLQTLTLQVGTYHECVDCEDAGVVQSYRVPGTSPLRVHLPESGPDADHFWITVSQTETGRQHVATTMPFHVSGLITSELPAATPG